MVEAYSGIQREPTPLSEAQSMANWFGDYLFGMSSELGDIPPLARQRCEELVGESELDVQSFNLLTERLMGVLGEAQADVAYYLCGYPDDALEAFASSNAQANILAFKRTFGPHTTVEPGRKNGRSPAQHHAVPRRNVSIMPQPPINKTSDKTLYTENSEIPLALAACDEKDIDWTAKALCPQVDPEIFFPEKGGSTREGKRICTQCEVRSNCLEVALERDERFGIWGGLSERERRCLKIGITTAELLRPPYSRVVQLVNYLHTDPEVDREQIEDTLYEDKVRLQRFVQVMLHWYTNTSEERVSKLSQDNLLAYFTGTKLHEICDSSKAKNYLVKDLKSLVDFLGTVPDDAQDPLAYCWKKSGLPDDDFLILNHGGPKPAGQEQAMIAGRLAVADIAAV